MPLPISYWVFVTKAVIVGAILTVNAINYFLNIVLQENEEAVQNIK